jgi:hypothetical protein
MSKRPRTPRPARAQPLRDDRAAGVVALQPRVAIAAALGSDPAAIAVERMGERDRVDGAQGVQVMVAFSVLIAVLNYSTRNEPDQTKRAVAQLQQIFNSPQ